MISVHSEGVINHPVSGTEDDDDARDDEHASENEALIREVDDEDGTDHPKDRDVDDEADEE
jgi:hypothetical protein